MCNWDIVTGSFLDLLKTGIHSQKKKVKLINKNKAKKEEENKDK